MYYILGMFYRTLQKNAYGGHISADLSLVNCWISQLAHKACMLTWSTIIDVNQAKNYDFKISILSKEKEKNKTL